MIFSPGSYDITCYQNADLGLLMTFMTPEDPAVCPPALAPVDFTGATAEMMVRPEPNSSAVLLALSSGDGLTLGGTAGTILVSSPASATEELPSGTAAYDIRVTFGDGSVSFMAAGAFLVIRAVTRDG